MYQTYEEKMSKLLNPVKSLETSSPLDTFPRITALTLKDYHDIISRDNVIVVDTPRFLFDLLTMSQQAAVSIPTYMPSTTVFVEVSTHHLTDLTEPEWKDSNLYFFYAGNSFGEKYQLRYSSIPKEIIQDAIDHFESSTRLRHRLNPVNSLESIREYANSSQFEKDKNIVSVSKAKLLDVCKNYIIWKTDSQVEASNVANKITEGIATC